MAKSRLVTGLMQLCYVLIDWKKLKELTEQSVYDQVNPFRPDQWNDLENQDRWTSTSAADYTLMQGVRNSAGDEISRFCYHERLSVAGNAACVWSMGEARRTASVLCAAGQSSPEPRWSSATSKQLAIGQRRGRSDEFL